MWQSSGKYVPTVEQLKEIAPAIIDMGCFARMETNGGEVEQINLLFGENPGSPAKICVLSINIGQSKKKEFNIYDSSQRCPESFDLCIERFC